MSSSHSSLLSLRRGLNAVTSAWQKLIARMCDPYRPEQHYMRGPGPRCRAKHAVHAAPAG
ncbi:MAG: hypothetical protein CFE30_07820 [Bradyrhizobium sp. PARBB1]|nr:MAG: hypothetical protein CFE30_07820 [Bradyrhizobium sp. PARBB1]PSO29144.1 hypothetical protein C7G43_00800 [Bradyrhizobium sp. MOS004]HAQ82154.1 hypothetical protein [Bradyrhizobium sp.]HAR16827.1 hypothetical protein [Bradyrhizobium sp.]HAR26095.1 hypothetical protein [Bradyrhizobium sp.]